MSGLLRTKVERDSLGGHGGVDMWVCWQESALAGSKAQRVMAAHDLHHRHFASLWRAWPFGRGAGWGCLPVGCRRRGHCRRN